MPAEKLTKKRLYQLIGVLCVLIIAFTYRTCHYTPVKVADTKIKVEKK